MSNKRYYTTQLGAGLGMIQETLYLLRLWQEGLTPAQLAEQAVKTGVFSRTTARRTRNIIMEMFAPRFLSGGGRVATRLKFLQDRNFSHDALLQICYLQTARSQHVFGDFVVEVYWPKYVTGANSLRKDDALQFIHRALDSGKMEKRWGESMIDRVSGYLLGCGEDFGLLSSNKRNERAIRRFTIRNEMALYLAYDLHFSGSSDMAVVNHTDWGLFGMNGQDVVQTLKTLSYEGHLLIQSSADLVQISWTYKSIEDCLNALTQRKV